MSESSDVKFMAVRACFVRYYNNVMELEEEAEMTDMSESEHEERLIALDNYFTAEVLSRANSIQKGKE